MDANLHSKFLSMEKLCLDDYCAVNGSVSFIGDSALA